MKLLSLAGLALLMVQGCDQAPKSGDADGDGYGDDGGGGDTASDYGDGGDGSDGGGYDGSGSDGGGDGSGSSGGGSSGGGSTGGSTDGADGSAVDTDEGGEEGGAPDTGLGDCDDVAPVTLFLSPDDSNSMASPVLIREEFEDGGRSTGSYPARTWEFMNYYSFDYDPPESELALRAHMIRDPDAPVGEYGLQIALTSPYLTDEERPLYNLVFSVDTSGSMDGERIDLVKYSMRIIASQLREGDVVSVVSWSDADTLLLNSHTVEGPDDEEFLNVIDSLRTRGTTDLYNGLTSAYMLADYAFSPTRINRVILMSDGGANAGVTETELIASQTERDGGEGIYLMGVGIPGSSSTYDDDLMDAVTDAGKGASVVIPDETEATEMFGYRFMSLMGVAGHEVGVQLDLPAGFEIVRYSGEEYSSDHTEIEPQNIASNDSMVFYQTIQTCAPEAFSEEQELNITARWREPITGEAREVALTTSFAELLAEDPEELYKGRAVYSYAQALRECRTTADCGGVSAQIALSEALLDVQAAIEADPTDDELAEIEYYIGLLLVD